MHRSASQSRFIDLAPSLTHVTLHSMETVLPVSLYICLTEWRLEHTAQRSLVRAHAHREAFLCCLRSSARCGGGPSARRARRTRCCLRAR